MSARADYRWLARVETSVDDGSDAARDVGAALDEIDRLRGWADQAAEANRSAAKAWALVNLAQQETEQLRAENRELRKLADLNALRRTLTNPALRRITQPVIGPGQKATFDFINNEVTVEDIA